MKKVFAAALAIAALVLLSFSLVTCKGAAKKNLLDQVLAKGEMIIALEGNWEPWSYHNDNDELVGFDVDAAKTVCERLGVKARFIELPWERIFASLERRECDIVVDGVEITSERLKRFYFTQPYAYDRMALITQLGNNNINSFEDLKGRTSGNTPDTTYYQIAEKYGAILIETDPFEETMRLLSENRIESTLNSDVCFYNYMLMNPGAPARIAALSETATPVAIVCRRDESNLTFLNELNQILTELHSDGTLDRLSLKYFGRDITN